MLEQLERTKKVVVLAAVLTQEKKTFLDLLKALSLRTERFKNNLGTSRTATFQVRFPFERRVLYEYREKLCAHE